MDAEGVVLRRPPPPGEVVCCSSGGSSTSINSEDGGGSSTDNAIEEVSAGGRFAGLYSRICSGACTFCTAGEVMAPVPSVQQDM